MNTKETQHLMESKFLQENGFLDDNTEKISLADKLEGKTKQYMESSKKVGWVFWFTVEKRKGWFKKFWKTRGSNYMEFQIYDWKITIGLPWHKDVIAKANQSYPLEGINHMLKTNEQNRIGIQKWGRFRFIKN
jgi:hypothetical protein